MKRLGLDIGTTTISIVVYDTEKGELLESCNVESKSFLSTENDWEKQQDPEKIWEKVQALLKDFCSRYRDLSGIGLTGQMHGILYVDHVGKSVSNLYTWQDGCGNLSCFAGKSICRIVKEEYGEELAAGYGWATHLYLQRKKQIPKEAQSFCSIMDYIGLRMTGRRKPLVHTSVAASFGLYDAENQMMKKEVLKKLSVEEKWIPQITSAVEMLGLYREIPVYTAIGDNQASFLGATGQPEHTMLLNMGTGGQISVWSKEFVRRRGLETRPFLKNQYLLVGSSLCGGRAYALLEQFFRSYLQSFDQPVKSQYAVMERILENMTEKEWEQVWEIKPLFAGSRENPKACGSMTGIRTDNFTPQAMIGGMLKGMIEELYAMCPRETAELLKIETLAGSGNGLRKNKFLQKKAEEIFGKPLKMSKYEEEAALGAAICFEIRKSVRH